MEPITERILSAAATVAVRPLVTGLAGGSRRAVEVVGRSLAERLDATLLPPGEAPIEPPVPRLRYCGTLHLGSDGDSAFWCFQGQVGGWHVLTTRGWAWTGAVPPPSYEPVCHCFADAAGVEPAVQPAC